MSTSPPSSPDAPLPAAAASPPTEAQHKRLVGPKFWSGVVAVPILLVLLYFGGWPLFVPSVAAMLIGMEEFYRGVGRKGIRPARVVGYVCSAGIFTATQFVTHDSAWRSGAITVCVAGSVLLSMMAQFRRPAGSSVIANTGATVFGVVWIGLLFSFFLRLRLVHLSDLPGIPAEGLRDRMGVIFLVMAGVWLQDNAAQLIGRTFGTRKPWPLVSPNKTWEGCAGGLLACLVATIGIGGAFGLPVLHMILLGFTMGVLGQLGDFCKSLIKRELGIKDFGSIIPGHGGILDRFDSLLFAMPVAHLYFRLFIVPS
jgi:phosphatidate cytidylyltransferase